MYTKVWGKHGVLNNISEQIWLYKESKRLFLQRNVLLLLDNINMVWLGYIT